MRVNPALLFLIAVFLGSLAGCDHKPASRSVTLTWEPPRTGGHMVVHYNLYRSTTSGKAFVKLASNLGYPWYQDRGVSSGHTYFYVVTALDPMGNESRFSNETEAKIP